MIPASRWRLHVHLEWKLGEVKLMWTLSLPVIFWSTIAIQLMGLGAIVAMRLFPSGRRHGCVPEAVSERALCAGDDHRGVGRCGQRFMGDIWGDFVGYDGLRDLRFSP